MEYGWIGGDPPERAPSVVVSVAHSALGAVRHLQVRIADNVQLLRPDTTDGWVRETADGLDVGAYLGVQLDLAGRDEPVGEPWRGTLPTARYAALRRADPADADALARTAGCPPELVRALAAPVALSRVEVTRRDGADRATGPERVITDELAWVDGGDAGLWTVRPLHDDAVDVRRGTPAEVAAELAGLVRAAEGC